MPLDHLARFSSSSCRQQSRRKGAGDLAQIQNMQNAVVTLERTLTKGPPVEGVVWRENA